MGKAPAVILRPSKLIVLGVVDAGLFESVSLRSDLMQNEM